MYHVAASFEVPVENQQKFKDAAFEDGRESCANELGTLRFELIKDGNDPNLFFLSEAYENEAAFRIHCSGPYYHNFFATINGLAKGPKNLIAGTRIEDPTRSNAAK